MIGNKRSGCVEWFEFALQIHDSSGSIRTVENGIPPSDFKPYCLCRKDSDSRFYAICPGI